MSQLKETVDQATPEKRSLHYGEVIEPLFRGFYRFFDVLQQKADDPEELKAILQTHFLGNRDIQTTYILDQSAPCPLLTAVSTLWKSDQEEYKTVARDLNMELLTRCLELTQNQTKVFANASVENISYHLSQREDILGCIQVFLLAQRKYYFSKEDFDEMWTIARRTFVQRAFESMNVFQDYALYAKPVDCSGIQKHAEENNGYHTLMRSLCKDQIV